MIELLDQQGKNKEFVEQIERDLKSKVEEERQLLCAQHNEKMTVLQNQLEEKEARLVQLASELATVQTTLTERGRCLGEAGEEIERLEIDCRAMVERETASHEENQKLKVQ